MRNGVDLGELVRSHGLQVVRERIAALANAVMRLYETQKVKGMVAASAAARPRPTEWRMLTR